MDIVLKKVSLSSLVYLKLSLESMIHNLEVEILNIENDYDSSSKYSKSFFDDLLKDKKNDLNTLRNLFKQF